MALDLKIPVYFVVGNHEGFSLLRDYKEVTEIIKNLFFVPNGTLLELDGRQVAFVGGASSVDKKWQVAAGNWYDDENIKDEDIAKLDSVEKVDILVSHVCAQSIIQKHMNPMNLLMFDLPITWRDPNADKIEKLWKRLDYPMSISGHLHCKIKDYQCRVLDILEVFCM